LPSLLHPTAKGGSPRLTSGDPDFRASWRQASSRPFAGMTRIRFEGFGLTPSQLAKSTPRNDGDFSRDRRNGKQNRRSDVRKSMPRTTIRGGGRFSVRHREKQKNLELDPFRLKRIGL
jgi:hypothetical protein